MQTAALVYRPPMPAPDGAPHYGESRFAPGSANTLRFLVAGEFALPIEDVADRLLRVITRSAAPNFQSALRQMRELPCFDIVMLNATLPGFNGVDDVRRACDEADGTPVVIFCNAGEERQAAAFLRNGAAGVIPGGLSGDAVAGAIQLILSGQRFAPAELLIGAECSDRPNDGLMKSLSNREKEVANLIAQGCPNKEIACRLGLQEITIKVYASSIFRKLGVRNRTAAAARLLGESLSPGMMPAGAAVAD